MEDQNKKIERYMEDRIKDALYSGTSDDFMSRLMMKVKTESEFAKEDKKELKLAKTILVSITGIIAAFAACLGYILLNSGNSESGTFDIFFMNLNGTLTQFFTKIYNSFGLNSSEMLYMILALIAISLLYNSADRLLHRK
jgi:hypothetical protein